ncbi:TPR Domain containing protein [Trichomonas vaginalis G3]|uniref:TPR Domain containing protein n=1 Tax=Trichomonas vaginalis (strain ATCC PRA-98 / G3) TaxID=412133 RepID=A2G2I1_TRIV3|nr:cellular component assembly [Trichomonas vaginalis G3]EAX88639.1 TPR Domain containing protein [Trichomonas vaginalis G3]KAI5501634.1 cellular component assembly [Trichomonas vaginalis G3]|eukprot:XP_001301569.1 TPR Domain containing protein [Trichomonas vaginalis G3]
MSVNPLQQVTPSIERANQEFESAWSSVLELSKFIGAEQDITIASHRLLSYNPQNKTVSSTNKNLSNAVNIICNFVTRKIEYVHNNPDDYNSWSTLAKCYLMLNDFPNAYTCVAHVIKLNENFQDATFWFVAGIVYQHFNYNQEALRFYRMSLQLEPHAPHIGDLNFRLAILYRSLNKPDDALPLFKSALTNLPPNLIEDDIKFQIAFTYQIQKQTDRANQTYNDLLRVHPRSLELNQQYAWFLSLSSDLRSLELAERIAKEAQDQYPNDPVLKFALACISLRQQFTTAAYNRYRECLNTWSDSPLFWCGLGILYLKNDQFQDAIVAFQRALFLRSDITEAWLNFGLIFQRQNRNDEALKIYQTALNNCNMAQQIQDRINAIKSPRPPGSMSPQYEICEISGDKFVTQVAEKVSLEYCADLPYLSVKAMGVPHEDEAAFELALSALYSPHASIF